MSRLLEGQFKSSDVVRVTGISFRQLQWWDEKGLIKPIIQGHSRFYDGVQIAAIELVRDLRRKGISLPQIRRNFKIAPFLALAVSGPVYVIATHSRFHYAPTPQAVVDILKKLKQPASVVAWEGWPK